MHGARPSGTGEYHLTIALFDATAKKRISGADVRARVAEIRLGGEEKRLQPMQIAGTETFGKYFQMSADGPFRVILSIRGPGQTAKSKHNLSTGTDEREFRQEGILTDWPRMKRSVRMMDAEKNARGSSLCLQWLIL